VYFGHCRGSQPVAIKVLSSQQHTAPTAVLGNQQPPQQQDEQQQQQQQQLPEAQVTPRLLLEFRREVRATTSRRIKP
jgi:hypothetical protein